MLGSPQAWFAKTPLDRYIVPPPELPQSTIFLCAGSEFLIQGRWWCGNLLADALVVFGRLVFRQRAALSCGAAMNHRLGRHRREIDVAR